MAFRADEAEHDGFERAKQYLVARLTDRKARDAALDKLMDILDEYGPVIERYPTWHPLVSNHPHGQVEFAPTDRSGYRGLDHTVHFANAFLTCPNTEKKAQAVVDSVGQISGGTAASITAERLDVPFYADKALPVLVRCDWLEPIENNGMIPLRLAAPLLLEHELPRWRAAEVAETWATMRPYFLGEPHGSRSSLFVNQETGQGLKKLWNAVIHTGMFGPLAVG